MNPQRPGKRKSSPRNAVFEVSDNDVSPDHSDSETDEPEAKLFKPESAFVESVVNALDDLEGDATRSKPVAEIPPEGNIPDIKHNEDIDNNMLPITCSENQGDSEVLKDTINVSNEDNVVSNDDNVVSNDVNVVSNDVNVVSNDDNVSNISNELDIQKKVEEMEIEKTIGETDLQDIDHKNDHEQEGEKIVLNPNIVLTKEEKIPQESDVDMTDTSIPDQHISINFSDERISELYKFRFLKFLQTFVELEVEHDDKLNISVRRDSLLNANEWIVLDETMCLDEHEQSSVKPTHSPPKEKTPKKKKKKAKKDKGLFVVDTNPSAPEPNTSIYSSKFNIDLNVEDEEQDVKISVQTCFNCDGKHAIRDCPLPKDFVKINAMRQKFKAQRQVSRYHLEDDQKYSHLVPGKISSQLRQALGLRKKQIPFYVYRMRVLGYPPGWLEEAKCVSSNLNMFDADGKNVRQTVKQKQGLDPTKIVDFPGFNVPLEKNFVDEFREYQVPPYSERFSKQMMLEYFDNQYAKENVGMDVDPAANDNNSNGSLQEVRQTVSPLDVIESVDNDDSITELVKQKEILLEALQDSSASNDKPDSTQEGKNSATPQPNPEDKETSIETTSNSAAPEKVDEEVDKDRVASPASNSVGCFRESSFGTPILKSSSRYSRIPKYDNFTKDVSPIINFENLPNSTGKYEQMTNVLQKVRKTMKQKQDCGT